MKSFDCGKRRARNDAFFFVVYGAILKTIKMKLKLCVSCVSLSL